MIMYHGTTLQAAEQIKREGLKPHRQSAFQLQSLATGNKLRDKETEKKDLIYLTDLFELAQEFAVFRAQYERTPNGKSLSFGLGTPQKKLAGSVDMNAKPVVLSLDLDETTVNQLEEDPVTLGPFAYICACTIPPERIKEVIPV